MNTCLHSISFFDLSLLGNRGSNERERQNIRHEDTQQMGDVEASRGKRKLANQLK